MKPARSAHHHFDKLLVLSLALLQIQTAWAQCGGATCEACLGGFNCVWNVATGICQEQCGDFPNVDCYYARTFGEGSTTAQVCTAAAEKVGENKVCFGKDSAQDCLKQAGCDWINGRIENSENRNWCALDVDYSPAAVPCSSDTCNGCLGDPNCVWNKGDACSNSCDSFPNVNCYYPKMFGVESDQSSVICQVANNSMTENEACFNETSQDDCFGISGCGWIPTDANDPKNVGFCTIYLANYDGSAGGGSGASSAVLHLGLLVFFALSAIFIGVW